MSALYEYIALFGSFGPGHGGRWLEHTLERIAHAGLVPTHLSVTGAARIRAKTLLEWGARGEHFRSEVQKDHFTFASIYSLPSRFGQAMFDWELASLLDKEKGVLFLGWRGVGHIDAMAFEDCLPIINAEYGYAECVPRGRGPINRPFGFSSGIESEEDRQTFSAWRKDLRNRRGLLRRYLRDVYEWNLLTKEHLARPIAGKPLSDWIASDEGRGRVEERRQRFLWSLPESKLAGVRLELLFPPPTFPGGDSAEEQRR